MVNGYPFESHFRERNGLRLHYLDEGQGEPLVMVHGNPTWSYYYRGLVSALRDRYRVVVPDHMGCGLSDKPGDDRYRYTLESRADDLEDLLEHLDIRERITLVVHDWGGMIGFRFATRHPERIARLVVLNTGAFHLPATKPLPWSLWLARNTGLGALLVRGLSAFSRSAVRLCATEQTLSAETRAAYLAPYDSWQNRIAVLRFVQDIPLRPGDPAWQAVEETQQKLSELQQAPMLICWGDRDFVFDHHFLAEWQRRFPEAEVHRFPEAGHFVLEDRGDEITTLVEQFLAAHPLEVATG